MILIAIVVTKFDCSISFPGATVGEPLSVWGKAIAVTDGNGKWLADLAVWLHQ